MKQRFQNTELIMIDNKKTYGLWAEPDYTKINELPPSKVITLKINGRYAGKPDLIANDYYGDPKYEWIVIMSNKPLNTLAWPKHGSTIRIPTKDLIGG